MKNDFLGKIWITALNTIVLPGFPPRWLKASFVDIRSDMLVHKP